jgi:purine-nucleoside phosphorylase
MNLEKLKNHSVKKAIILGSGVSVLEGKKPLFTLPYSSIPNWPVGQVKGHKGCLDVYEDIWVLRGRAHLYEGFSWFEACFPTQFLADCGIKKLIITNAAGGINPDFEIGDLMQITGYLNFMKPSQPRGNLPALLEPITKIKTTLIPGLANGVYVGVHGPNYETDAEVKIFRHLGGSAVGMSTIPELETATANNIDIKAISIITNVYGKTEDLGHEGVVKAASQASRKLTDILGIS